MEIRYNKQVLKVLSKLDKSMQNKIRLVKRCVLAWDPDYTKLTPQELKELENAKNSEYVPANEIDWDNLNKY